MTRDKEKIDYKELMEAVDWDEILDEYMTGSSCNKCLLRGFCRG